MSLLHWQVGCDASPGLSTLHRRAFWTAISAPPYACGATHRSIRAMPVFWLGTKRGTMDMATMIASTCRQQPPPPSCVQCRQNPPASNLIQVAQRDALNGHRHGEGIRLPTAPSPVQGQTTRADQLSYPFDSLDIFGHLLIVQHTTHACKLSQLRVR